MSLSQNDELALRNAVYTLENPSFAARLADMVGTPIGQMMTALPAKWSDSIHGATTTALHRAMDWATESLEGTARNPNSDRLHKVWSGISGGIGGFFGLAGLAVELPVSTVIMLRSIADVARDEGEEVTDPRARLACLEVFALGGTSKSDDAAETGYYAIRGALASSISQAARYVAQRGLAGEAAPPLVRFITQVASRFGVAVSEKVAAQAVPVIGAIGGASINVMFMDHFQNIARGHFTIRRLERKYGEETVREAYERMRNSRQE